MAQDTLKNRTIFCRDNLEVLRGINSNSIDLIYLDPPFSKNDTFITKGSKKVAEIKRFFLNKQKENKLFLEENFDQIFKDNSVGFKDIWTENDVNKSYYSEIDEYNNQLVSYFESIKASIFRGGFYYLIYMAIRLIEMKRILKDTGGIYYHCDPTLSHYIKNVMDKIFGYDNFRNEIVWYYSNGGGRNKNKYNKKHDYLLYYTKSKAYTYNWKDIGETREKQEGTFSGYFKTDEIGRRYQEVRTNKKIYKYYLDEPKNADDVFFINIISQRDKTERIGYPTQKPLALLEKIIKASSKEGDIVLDPFCGCATTCIAAEYLNRKWIGIDKKPQAFYMVYYRAYNSRDLLGTKVMPNMYGDIIQSTEIPKRTDLSAKEIEAIRIVYERKERVRREKKLSPKERAIAKELLYEDQAGMCNGCDVYMRSADLTIDHIAPKIEDGEDDLDNLQLLCYRCNVWKGKLSMGYLFKKLKEERIITEGTFQKQMNKRQ